MKISASVYSTTGDEFRLYIETVNDKRLPDEVAKITKQKNIEIVEVELAHVTSQKASLKTLMAITRLLANIFEENKNIILYFYCDDINDVARRHEEMSPQEFRSMLFSKMFERYVDENNIDNVYNIPIHIQGEGYKVYQHILVRREHMAYTKTIRESMYKDYGK